MANKDVPNGFRAVKSLSGSYIPMFPFMTKDALTLNPGDAVIMLSNGTVDIALATSTAIFGVCQSKVTAITSTSQKVLVVPASRDIVFEGQCSGTFSPVNVGEAVDIEGSTGIMEINENLQTVGCAQIIGLAKELDNAAGANARVLFTWKKSQWDGIVS